MNQKENMVTDLEIEYDGLTLEVDLTYHPPVINNTGHPDTRMEDEPEEFIIHDVRAKGWDDEELLNLIKARYSRSHLVGGTNEQD